MGSIHPKVQIQQTHPNKHSNLSSCTTSFLFLMKGNIKTVTLHWTNMAMENPRSLPKKGGYIDSNGCFCSPWSCEFYRGASVNLQRPMCNRGTQLSAGVLVGKPLYHLVENTALAEPGRADRSPLRICLLHVDMVTSLSYTDTWG